MPFRSSTATTNSIRLKRQCHRGCFLVVEGQDDQRFFSKFINPESCQITVANGKEYVIEVVHSLETECFSGIVGIVDADLDHIEGIRQSSNNLITLETVDLEALMIRSEALDSLLSEWASADKMAALGKDIREILIKIAAWTGCLRLYSYRNEYSLKFTKLKYAKCIDRVSLTVNIDDLVQEVLNLSQRPDLSTSDIVKEIKVIHHAATEKNQVPQTADRSQPRLGAARQPCQLWRVRAALDLARPPDSAPDRSWPAGDDAPHSSRRQGVDSRLPGQAHHQEAARSAPRQGQGQR